MAPETPGSIHEGGELGYSLVHAYGAAFDNPNLIVACVIGDGESETGPLAGSWHSNKFLDPARDGAVLPILHLNGYKIANPTVPGPDPARRVGVAAARLRVRGAHGRGRRPQAGPPAAGRHAGRGDRGDPRHPAAGPVRGRPVPPGLAGHHLEDAQGMSGQGRRWWTGCHIPASFDSGLSVAGQRLIGVEYQVEYHRLYLFRVQQGFGERVKVGDYQTIQISNWTAWRQRFRSDRIRIFLFQISG